MIGFRIMLLAAGFWLVGGAAGIGASKHRELAPDHYVPVDKKLSKEWVDALFDPGERKVYRGDELKTLGMPCGGICAGQLYVRGDGTLAHWWIANDAYNTGYGQAYQIDTELGPYNEAYQAHRPFSPVEQGFAVRVKPQGGNAVVRKLNREDFDDIGFIGEYPVATVNYGSKSGPSLPVSVRGEVFSPFIPLNARDSAMPATILQYTIKNTSDAPVDVAVAGWVENMIGYSLRDKVNALRRNRVVAKDEGLSVAFDLIDGPEQPEEPRRVKMFEDFEAGSYDGWEVEGEAFGSQPATGTLEGQHTVSGYNGDFLVNTYLGGDDELRGKLTSKPFTIDERYICFLIGGGNHKGRACMNLLVDGEVVRSSTGRRSERLEPACWDVSDLKGKQAQIEIVDNASEAWGHINIDDIAFTNLPAKTLPAVPKWHPQVGDIALTALSGRATACSGRESVEAIMEDFAEDGTLSGPAEQTASMGADMLGAVATGATLEAGGERKFVFVLSWFFPNRHQDNAGVSWGEAVGRGAPVGNMYANWFDSALDVGDYITAEYDRLAKDTFLFRDTYFDTTLPYWFAHRIGMPVSNLATETCQWWANGRFWAWEGVGCCHGTCSHVWNYAHGHARLFPQLARSTREMQDLGDALDLKTGAIAFRGPGGGPAADGQAGNVLKMYREHLTAPDYNYLKRNWPRIKLAIKYLLDQDGNGDGLIEGSQHNTYDINFEGANTFVGSLYLAALRAGEEMAESLGDRDFARKLRSAFRKGGKLTVERLWNGEYFIQEVDLEKHPRAQYGKGCLADQMFGQGWAHQVGLGYVYPKDRVVGALKSVWRYNWAPDVVTQNKHHKPERVFAKPGEAGLFICTWPLSKHLDNGVRYRNEVWTGIEYQVAGNMLAEGMSPEGLAIIRAVHERYNGVKHNPWNEIECGDHYARALASWGCLIAAEGFIYDGPAGKIGFAPRINRDIAGSFKGFFTGAEGWGSLVQERKANGQTNRIEVKWGRLRVKTLVFELPQGVEPGKTTVRAAGDRITAKARRRGERVVISLSKETIIPQGEHIEAVFAW